MIESIFMLYAYLPGDASGGIVLSRHDPVRDAALNLIRLFARESCGQCTPRRTGTEKADQLMQATPWDAPLLEALSQAMGDASICTLGQAAPDPIRCALKSVPHKVG